MNVINDVIDVLAVIGLLVSISAVMCAGVFLAHLIGRHGQPPINQEQERADIEATRAAAIEDELAHLFSDKPYTPPASITPIADYPSDHKPAVGRWPVNGGRL